MSGDNRCRMLCFGIRDAVEVFTGSSIFAEDAYWNVSATGMRSFCCLQYLLWSVPGDDWLCAGGRYEHMLKHICALARSVRIHGAVALSPK